MTESSRRTGRHAFSLEVEAGKQTHIKGVAGSCPALLAAALRDQTPAGLPVVLVVADSDTALELIDDLATFAPTARALFLPTTDRTPFDSVRPDRSVALSRAAALSALDHGRCDFLVTTAVGWIRRCAPRDLLDDGSLELRKGELLSLTEAASKLSAGGYTRVPIVEDPGTFTVRGDIVDLWPAGRTSPLRIEVDFDKLVRIRSYDPETQVTFSEDSRDSIHDAIHDTVLVPPAREAVLTHDTKVRVHEVLRALCDACSFPSKKARNLIEDVTAGHLFIGSDAYLPAFIDLEPLSARLPEDAPIFFVTPDAICAALDAELDSAENSRSAQEEMPHFELGAHYLQNDELDRSIEGRTVVCLHDLAALGSPSDGFSSITVAPANILSFEATDQRDLTIRLKNSRESGGRHASLAPLVRQIDEWQTEGLCVVLCARARTQADRLGALLEHRGLNPNYAEPDFFRPSPQLHVITAPLARGLVAKNHGLVLLTEEEIFGRRAHRSRKRATAQLASALDDLRSLSEGDYIVHVEHGIGRYLGLSHHRVGPNTVELLVVEYQAGDKLLLPVYRLNQIQKFSGEGSPKLDRLGGQTFAKTKSKVRKKVRIMADQLLKLYAERNAVRRPPVVPPGDEYATFEATFPFEETPDQAAAIEDVLADLAKDTVMDRLVCGDVGFGKTEVALRAAFVCAHAGRQVALLCPTTVLSEQHLRTFSARLSDSGIAVRGLSRFQSKKTQAQTLAGLKSGAVDVVIGTHRLLSNDVHFKSLGLLIVDEEQRFGVAHKERLKELRKTVDVLTLSATPIPRTLNLAVSGLRDMSVIATAPLERRAIRTITSRFDERIIERAIADEITRGGQVYYVHNRVEGIYERAEILRRLLPDARIAVGHGQMTERALEKTMLGFVAGDYDVLCATSIVESGLDIPAANTIIIDRADLFGLAQLYQIRGRVGRSSERAYCYLLIPSDAKLSAEARARISALEQYTELGSGFHVATMDMELRGAGELLGADQSGFVARVGFDLFAQMLEEATAELRGETYIAEVDPELSIDVEAFLPETYIDDIGIRLSLYKRFALAENEDDVERISRELEDRFGPPPEQARRFSEVMRLKTDLRRLRALGLSASGQTATLHLRDDTPLSGERLVTFVAQSKGLYHLSPDGRLTRRLSKGSGEESGLAHADRMMDELCQLLD